MIVLPLVALTLLAQLTLALPGLPSWAADVLVPMIWVVGPPMGMKRPQWPYVGLVIGVSLDIVLAEPVVGPGGIAWAAAALAARWLSTVMVDRSPKAWFALGAAATVVVIVVRYLALLPLGLATRLIWPQLAFSSLLTAAWCALVAGLFALDLPKRWRSRRSRRLR